MYREPLFCKSCLPSKKWSRYKFEFGCRLPQIHSTWHSAYFCQFECFLFGTIVENKKCIENPFAKKSPNFSYFNFMKTYYVYILSCSDGTYYTGVTSNLTQRLEDHQHRKHLNSYTSSRLPVELVYYCTFTEITMAISTEKQIKKWSKAKKEALINEEYNKLPNLAKKKFNK